MRYIFILIMLVVIQNAIGQEKTELLEIKSKDVLLFDNINNNLMITQSKDGDVAFLINYERNSIMYFLNHNDRIIDSVKLHFNTKKFKFKDDSIVLLTDIKEKYIYKYNIVNKVIDSIKFNSPEEWFFELDEKYKCIFDLYIYIPALYIPDNPHIQIIYNTRFNYYYNFIMDSIGNIYQVSSNSLILKICPETDIESIKKDTSYLVSGIYYTSKIVYFNPVSQYICFKYGGNKLYINNLKTNKINIIESYPDTDFSIAHGKNYLYEIYYNFNKNRIILNKISLKNYFN